LGIIYLYTRFILVLFGAVTSKAQRNEQSIRLNREGMLTLRGQCQQRYHRKREWSHLLEKYRDDRYCQLKVPLKLKMTAIESRKQRLL
jgi:hypothetical protein